MSPGGTRTRGPALMLHTSTSESLFYAWFNIAFRLAANRCQFRNHQVASPLKHPLLTKRKRLEVTEVGQVLEHVCSFKNVAGAHLLGEVFETILPIVSGKREIVC